MYTSPQVSSVTRDENPSKDEPATHRASQIRERDRRDVTASEYRRVTATKRPWTLVEPSLSLEIWATATK